MVSYSYCTRPPLYTAIFKIQTNTANGKKADGPLNPSNLTNPYYRPSLFPILPGFFNPSYKGTGMNHRLFLLLIAALLDPDKRKLIELYESQLDALRSQIPGRLRFTQSQKARMAEAARALGRKALRELSTIVTPDTLFRWYKESVRQKWDYSNKRRPGRPNTKAEIERFIIQFAQENKDWGYTRLRDALKENGFTVCRNTVKNILKKHGITPAPKRNTGMSWAEFTQTHWEALVGTDFFTWEGLTPFGLVTYYVLFFIRQKTREVHIAGITTNPDGGWMKQMARNLTMSDWGWLRAGQMVLHDRGGQFCPAFRRVLNNAGVKTYRLPFQSPNLNAYAERWVRSVKEECLSKMIIVGEPMLRRVLQEYLNHYHAERTHQGLKAIPFPSPELSRGSPTGRILRRQRLGGILNFYYREGANVIKRGVA
jgi:putative transposase